MAKKSIIIFVLYCFFSSTSIFSQEPLIDFQYWDTFSFQDDGFVAQHTYLEDINNHGVMVGRFINESGNTEAFVFYENFKMIRYSHPGYAHTEFLGINDNGIIIGAAYDITTNRLPIYIKLVDASSSTPSYNSTYVYKNELQTPAIEMNFGYVGGDNRYPQKISNFNNLAVGTVNTATVGRWLHYIEYDASEYGGESIIYSISSPFTSYSTYGLSLNNEGKLACGFYIDGANNFPYIYDMEEEEFYTETAGLPSANRVKFNDINNSEYVAFTFRNTSGVWVAGLAKREYSIFSGYYFTDYATFPFKNTTFGSSCTGINDDNDVVGYYSVSSDRTVAFFAVTHEWKIPDFDFNTDRFSFKNVPSSFVIGCPHWDDPFLRFKHDIMDSPLVSLEYSTIISRWDDKMRNQLKLEIGTSAITLDELLPLIPENPDAFDHLSPNFISFVSIRGENNTYIGQKILVNELYKFTDHATFDFEGFCYGMVLAAMTNNSQYTMLKDKFIEYFPLEAKNDAIDYIGDDVNMTSIIGALQFTQSNTLEYENFYTKYIEIIENVDIPSAHKEMEKIARNLMGKESCRLFQKLAFDMTTSPPKQYNHATLPYKIIRKLTDDLEKTDSIYAYDPNYLHPVKYVVYYNLGILFQEFIPDESGLVYTEVPQFLGCAGASLDEVSFYNSEGMGTEFYERTSSGYRFHVASSADFKIENTITGTYFEKSSGEITYDMPLTLNSKFTGYNDVKSIKTNSTFPAKTTITNPVDGGYTYDMEYPDGRMFVTRIGTEPSQTDIIYHNDDYQKIENPDAVSKEYSMSTIYNPSSTEESFVQITGFELENNDTVSLYNVDQYHFHLLNGNEDGKSYQLRVRYLSEDDFFHVKYEEIDIDSDTRHIILLQPSDETNKVIILVDRGIDGIIDDTMNIIPSNIYEVDKWNDNISIYPNPSSDVFHLMIDGVKENKNIHYEVFDVTGKIIKRGEYHLNSGSNKYTIDMHDQSAGMYFFILRSGREILTTQKLLKN